MSNERSGQLTRRRFLGTTLAAAAPLVDPAPERGPSSPKTRGPRLNVACIGLGAQMQGHLKEITANLHQNLIAVCDVDDSRVAASAKANPVAMARAKVYKDYRQLLASEKTLDAVIIATPDHWHAPICTAAIRARKHVYCEKPLAHTIADTRRLRELSRRAKVVTQTGNHGSASANMRRSIELIEAGVFGQIREVHVWHPAHHWPSGVDRPAGEDPIPIGLDWDFWLGPSPDRPYKRGEYHPGQWRGWYDFGGGSLADFCCHAFNLPVRALKLAYPRIVEVSGRRLGKDSFPSTCIVRFRFPERGRLDPVTIFFYTGGWTPPAELTDDLKLTFGAVPTSGCLMIGEKGIVSAGLWNTLGHMKMNGDKTYHGVNGHKATKNVPVTLPRVEGHMREWVDACLGGPATFSNFDIGGHITEIGLAGVLALRVGYDIEWDGERMRAPDVPEAEELVNPEPREGWRV